MLNNPTGTDIIGATAGYNLFPALRKPLDAIELVRLDAQPLPDGKTATATPELLQPVSIIPVIPLAEMSPHGQTRDSESW